MQSVCKPEIKNAHKKVRKAQFNVHNFLLKNKGLLKRIWRQFRHFSQAMQEAFLYQAFLDQKKITVRDHNNYR